VPFAGASNIAGGITIDLSGLDDIVVHQEKNTISVGAGNKWVDVYRELEKYHITVVGGRIADVGVGGLTLGGGISFFSNMYGWACDNIASYEVVMANGEVISASATSHSDLYWALRGGANNFGLVTKFDMISYPHHNSLMWVGKLLHPLQASPGLIKAFVDFGHQDSDSNATVLFSYVYLQDQKQYVISSETDYAVPVPEGKSPPAFDAFFNEPDAIETRKETKRVVEAIEEHSTSNPSGKRQTYWTATFVLDSSLAEQLVYIWQEELETIQHRVTGIVPVLTFQIVTARMMQYMKKYGGNALGLDGTQGPLMIVTPSAMWTDSTHDDEVLKAYANWLSRATARAQEMGLRHRYLYTNYASQFQNPMAGYGTKNLERLKSIARKYDPEGVFQSLQPGYFKL
jgi:FAD/FMN-containing dehydrogenase